MDLLGVKNKKQLYKAVKQAAVNELAKLSKDNE